VQNLIAQRQITKLARVEKKNTHTQAKYKNKVIIIIIIIFPLTQIKVESKVYTFINNTNNNIFKFNSIFLSFNTTAIEANYRTSTIK
jgi:hypothetical protein